VGLQSLVFQGHMYRKLYAFAGYCTDNAIQLLTFHESMVQNDGNRTAKVGEKKHKKADAFVTLNVVSNVVSEYI